LPRAVNVLFDLLILLDNTEEPYLKIFFKFVSLKLADWKLPFYHGMCSSRQPQVLSLLF